MDALTSKAKETAAQWKEAGERVMTVVSDLNRKKKHEEDKIHAFFEEVSAFFLLSFMGILSVYISDMIWSFRICFLFLICF